MVNFNDPNTLSIPVSNISKILILEKQQNILIAIEQNNQTGGNPLKSVIRSRIITYFYQIRLLLEKYFPKEYLEVKDRIFSENLEELIYCFEIMEKAVYNLGIIDSNQEVLL